MFDVQRVQQSWQQEVDGMNGLVCDLSEAEAQAPIREDGWTTQDLVHHIVSTARAFGRMARPQEAGGITLSSAHERDRWNDEQRLKNAETSWSTTRQSWTKTSHEMSALLANLTSADAERLVTIPWLPQVSNVGDMLRVLVIHTRSHHSELSNGLQALAMRNC